jgi:hypothetical protein
LATRRKRGLHGVVADDITGNQQTAIAIIHPSFNKLVKPVCSGMTSPSSLNQKWSRGAFNSHVDFIAERNEVNRLGQERLTTGLRRGMKWNGLGPSSSGFVLTR